MTPIPADEDYFTRFQAALTRMGPTALHQDEVGAGVMVPGPFGAHRLIYADYTASGRALMSVEQAVLGDLLPWYANSHTEASHCGSVMTRLRRAARAYIAAQVGAGADHAVVFTGSGATAGINRLVHLLGVAQAVRCGQQARVLIGPYEHHSNILPWRESGAEIVDIPEAAQGGPDLAAIHAALVSAPSDAVVVGAFSAASNVTGALSDVAAVTRLLNQHGARAVWDYAAGGPYLPIDMQIQGTRLDAVVVSPHKFIGGPGASGVMVVRRDAVCSAVPSLPGGGTVAFVSPQGHRYATDVVAREEGGTPNVMGDLRAAMAFAVKAAIGADHMVERNAHLARLGSARLQAAAGVELLAARGGHLPIFAFRLRDTAGQLLNHQLATRLLSDLFGVQARGGCACAGPYVHRLLDIDAAQSQALDARLQAGEELAKPGFVRLNLSALHTGEEVETILNAVAQLPGLTAQLGPDYVADPARAIFRHRSHVQAA
ncbi:MAG TPA: aminotransferase class V-fold PLP-dependent enzyme [Paenirhodobacter sp.]